LVSAALQSTDGKSHLLMRCKDRKTEVAVSIRGFIKCGTEVRGVYRVDQKQATDGPWNSHPSCYIALGPSPIPLVRALSSARTLAPITACYRSNVYLPRAPPPTENYAMATSKEKTLHRIPPRLPLRQARKVGIDNVSPDEYKAPRGES